MWYNTCAKRISDPSCIICTACNYGVEYDEVSNFAIANRLIVCKQRAGLFAFCCCLQFLLTLPFPVQLLRRRLDIVRSCSALLRAIQRLEKRTPLGFTTRQRTLWPRTGTTLWPRILCCYRIRCSRFDGRRFLIWTVVWSMVIHPHWWESEAMLVAMCLKYFNAVRWTTKNRCLFTPSSSITETFILCSI